MTEKVEVSRDISDLKPRTYYIVKVRFFEGNWEHNSIFYHHSGGHGKLWKSGYEHPHDINFATFYEIEVLQEINGLD